MAVGDFLLVVIGQVRKSTPTYQGDIGNASQLDGMVMGRRSAKVKTAEVVPARSGLAVDSEAIKLYVPKPLMQMALKCLHRYSAPVEIESYNRFGKTMFARIRDRRIICVVSIQDFINYVNGDGRAQLPDKLTGKMLLVTNRDSEESISTLNLNGVDLLAEDTAPNSWTFKINKALAEIENDREMQTIRAGEIRKRRDLDTMNEIGLALSTEKDLDQLLDLIISNCREMTDADGGSLYFIEADPDINEDLEDYFANKKMRFRVAQTFSRDVPFRSFLVDIKKTAIFGYVAITQRLLNIEDAYFIGPDEEYNWGGREFDAAIGYRTKSMLTVPMVNYRGETIGVIQLINRKVKSDLVLGEPETCVDDILSFTEDDERMALSIASQASIAIQNAQLVDDIKNLFNGFINASVKAIESRDPTTSGHSQRVAELTVAIAEAVDKSDDPKFRDLKFNYDAIQELRYASLLHDFGKIGVREDVLIKAKKLYPAEKQSVLDRFNMIRRTAEVNHLSRQLEHLMSGNTEQALALVGKSQKELAGDLSELDEYLAFIFKCNEPTVMAQGGFEQLQEIAALNFKDWEGTETPYLTEKEMISLSVPRGSLNENDRKEIESHVTHTYKFLSEIPWTADLRKVPEIAYAHHEKLDGTGYPNKLTADTIPIGAKIMTVADIFDALTAWDRPYKKAVPLERALNILVEEAKAAHVDKDILEIFISAELYKIVETSG